MTILTDFDTDVNTPYLPDSPNKAHLMETWLQIDYPKRWADLVYYELIEAEGEAVASKMATATLTRLSNGYDVSPIPFEDEVHGSRTEQPIATPLADLLEADHNGSDAAGLDGEFMSYNEWLKNTPVYEFEEARQ